MNNSEKSLATARLYSHDFPYFLIRQGNLDSVKKNAQNSSIFAIESIDPSGHISGHITNNNDELIPALIFKGQITRDSSQFHLNFKINTGLKIIKYNADQMISGSENEFYSFAGVYEPANISNINPRGLFDVEISRVDLDKLLPTS
jgi:hypothetical protein